jgi:NADPH-dependent glutamate synthase beta subunit-like oxidoreductase
MHDASDSAAARFDYGRAYAEACRCLLCHDAPCSKACPASTDPALFLRKFRMRNVKGAIRTIKQNNILGGACGALCPTTRLCEQACCASGIDRPVRIGRVQQFLVEHAWQLNFQPLVRVEPTGGHVAVVGSGPAGLACAAELASHGCKVTVFEERARPGGVLAWGVPTWRLSAERLERELDDVRYLGVQLKCLSPVQGPGAAEGLLQQGFDAVFLAPGCWKPERLRKEEVSGVMSWTTLLTGMREGRQKELSHGLRGKAVAVLGGGSVAMDCVQVCHRLGASEVYLVYRRSYTQMPAEADEKLEALNAGTHFLLLNQPVGYERGSDAAVCGVKLVRTRLGEPDGSGRRSPIELAGSDWVLSVDAVVEALGSSPEDASPGWYPSVKVDGGRLVQIEPASGRTSHPAIYAGGDIASGPALIVTAVRDGKNAARAILRQLGKADAQ